MDAVSPLRPRDVVAPLLPALPGAAIATQPAAAVLPLLAPILRQRVLFLSETDDGGSREGAAAAAPWIRLLAYDAAKAARLVDVARSARLEPHLVSGEVELDWDSAAAAGGTDEGDVAVRYKRLDVETLQALVLLRPLGLVFGLVYCADEGAEGSGGDGGGGGGGGKAWRVGEVSTPDEPDAYAVFGGHATLAEAEQAFRAAAARDAGQGRVDDDGGGDNDDDDDDDGDYWARYDATPARTPAVKRSPAPTSAARPQQPSSTADDDAYFALYDSVQPAMDNHDPDEVVEDDEAYAAAPLLAHDRIPGSPPPPPPTTDAAAAAPLVHPRPSSASSGHSSGGGGGGGGSAAVDKLEASAARREQSAFGVQQHVSRSIKSLYLLARSAGIERDEFAQLVQTEVAMLALMEE